MSFGKSNDVECRKCCRWKRELKEIVELIQATLTVAFVVHVVEPVDVSFQLDYSFDRQNHDV